MVAAARIGTTASHGRDVVKGRFINGNEEIQLWSCEVWLLVENTWNGLEFNEENVKRMQKLAVIQENPAVT